MESGDGREQSCPLTAEEESLKRNTDCVYFLASPLTCKKGIECEYRHSEGARLNPMDCWYWINGNCWNPKCTFRHPPLDGLFGIQGTTSRLAPPPSQTVALTHVPATNGSAAYNLNKQNVPCYYFQKGHCLKGDRCPFMHGPQQTDNLVPQQVARASTSPPDPVSVLEKELCGLKESSFQKRMHRANFDKPVEVPLDLVKSAAKSENVLNNGSAIMQTALPYPSEDELPRVQQSNVPVNSGIVLDWTQSRQPIDEHFQNGREADEFLKESSPGFDVLVDNNMEDSDYFHNEGDFVGVPIQGGRNLNHVSDFDYHHSDHGLVSSLERDRYNGIGDYDRYGCLDNRYGRQQQRTSSERILERAPMPEKRMLQREEGYHDTNGSDLRDRLLKKRRLNGLRSAISPDCCGKLFQWDNCLFDEERHHVRHPSRSHRRFPMESSISSRLQGRITFPARFSSDRPTDLWSEKDRDKGRHRGRSSPVSPENYQGRHHDKIKRRPVFSDGRNVGVQPIRREDADRLNFAGPKSLSELKGAKLSENFQDQKNIKGQALGHQESEGSLSFEGPKPLSVILKRKRGTAENGANCSNVDKNNQRYIEGGIGASASEATEKSNHAANCPKESKVAGVDEEEGQDMILIEGKELANDHRTSAKGNTHEGKDGMIMDDEQEVELAESDYEAVERGEFQPEDDDMYQEDEEDDEDDFARKVGIMFS